MAALPAGAAAAEPVVVDAPWFSCSSGKYALTLPRHHPSLRNIGRHRIIDREVRRRGAVVVTARTMQYAGLRLELLLRSDEPSRYELLAVESSSRRWHIGRLSVGTDPWWWPWSREKSISKVRLEGVVRLAGPVDSAVLSFHRGRIEKVLYTCRPGDRD